MSSEKQKTPLRYRAAHTLWRQIPRGLRHGILQNLLPRMAPAKDAEPPAKPMPLAVVGQLTTPSGMGHSARICLDSLDRLGLAPRQVDLSHAFNIHHPDLPTPPQPPLQPGEGGSLILHINGPYVAYVMNVLGRRQVAGRRLIGYWHWELPVAPPSWRRGASALHEIWVPTAFVAEAIRPLTDGPVRIVPHPVPQAPPVKPKPSYFGWDPDSFVVLVAANVASGFFRKNVLGAITCFRRAFGTDPKVRLVIKLADLSAWPAAQQQVRDAIGRASNIEVIDRVLTRNEMDLLLASADTVLSLHRAEGFGLVPAEAMRLGRPVVTTAWSGNMDYMDDNSAGLVSYRLVPTQDPQKLYNLPGQRWAEPDLDHAVEWLRRLRADPELRQRIGKAAKAKAAACFDLPAYAQALVRALPGIAGELRLPVRRPPSGPPTSPPTTPPASSPKSPPAPPPASSARGGA